MHKDGRSWRQLINILNHLPSHSHYITAKRNDPQIAAWIAQQPESRTKWAPPAPEWSLVHELVAAGIDRLGELIVTMINLNRDKPIEPPDPFPRPRTEVDRAREQFLAAVEDELADVIADAQAFWVEERGESPPTDN